jgi:predicted DCC family thiol-disulfide oxidoreductase YuxK
MSVLAHLKKTFSFDYRSLALYRFLIGLLVMCDVIYRWEDLTNFYTDVGLIPRSIFVSEMAMPWSFSFHLANGSYAFAAGMFALHFLFGLMLVFGYKTRWAMFGAYLMTVSVHNRNWLVNNGGDDVLRAILFLSIFLPLNRRFSLDAALTKEREPGTERFSIWGLAFFFQVFAIYFVSYVLKDSDIWRTNFTAVFFSSRLDIFATPLGIWLRDFPFAGKAITFLSIYLEWLGPLLLVGAFLFRTYWWQLRTFLVVTFVCFHFGIFLTMNIGLFTFICEAMWMLFLPGPLWDRLGARYRARGFGELAIYYDADCGFCQKGVRILREFLLFPDVALRPAQETPDVYRDMQEQHSWVVVNGAGERFFHYAGFLEILRHSPVGRPFRWFFALAPSRSVGERVYRWVSHHRPFMGKASQFLAYREPRREVTTAKWLSEIGGALIFVTLLMWNLTTIKKYDVRAPFFQDVTRWLHLYQEWNMFAPFPKMDNIWVEIPAVLGDGSELELLTGSRDIYSIKDQGFYAQIPNEHWRKFYLNMSDRHDYARYYGGYLCRMWNDRRVRSAPETTLRKFEIIVYSQPNLADGGKGGINRKLSWRHWCFAEDYKREAKDPQ